MVFKIYLQYVYVRDSENLFSCILSKELFSFLNYFLQHIVFVHVSLAWTLYNVVLLVVLVVV